MACSKLFSGKLPELLNEIIQYFRGDFLTLHSCILVNRLWCRLAIPLLWENPFSVINCRNYYSIENHKIRFIETYLVHLNDNDKIKLNEFGIELPSSTLFNYPKFINHLHTRIIGYSIEKWVVPNKKIEPPYISIKNTQNSDFIKFIYKSLIKIFIENEANLHTFDITPHRDYFNIIDLVLQNPNFICNIRNLNLKFDTYDTTISNINLLLKFLSLNCNSITSLYFPNFDKYKASTAIEYLSQLIKSQKNLKKILFSYKFPHSILLNSNCLNTLRTIIFYCIDFKNINILYEVFEQLNVLESIHIIYCHSLNYNFIQQIINLTKPFKLTSLFVSEIFESIELLLQKSGDYLENFGFPPFKIYEVYEESESQLLKLITKYCTKINYFELLEFNSQNIYPTFNLIENIKQNLNYLIIDVNFDSETCYISDDEVELSSIVLQNLGKVLPFKLEYLNLSLMMSTNDFEIFLKNSQNIFIKKLLLQNFTRTQEVRKTILLPYIKDYIMSKKRVEYLACVETSVLRQLITKSNDLFSLKDEVKEFKLYNVIVQNYNDLQIQFSEVLENY
ncbi:hypothetical protein RclHR1_15700003 [Rhizophagus clarus]|uniref:F-box domain-containing protein n=1 Tax=Rhizophagus clarus TaxID=94130 RepID=A0A2Z6R8C3_9GLOM|nr:hypothetical protein RclHR1_15700003 [Rhizophagus clarus]GES79374.1 hypothetical protein GLOIN_2v1776883 [Rhizophagus clarus]